MGNHEYCGECGASDFHYNRPCNPKTKAAFQAELEKHELAVAARKKTVADLAEAIMKVFPQAKFTIQDGHAMLKWWDH